MAETFIEGAWEDIIALAPKLSGRRVRVTFLEQEAESKPAHRRRVQEILADFAASVPEEELAKIPPDFTDQLDHYTYGTPKK